VGAYAPNALGLYDMHGNVAELCDLDRDQAFYKGGCYDDPPEHAPAWFYSTDAVPAAHDGVGLRAALVPRAK
jgi:formylglycine-generating enzyme required for sulfatase activity